jgi:EspG family
MTAALSQSLAMTADELQAMASRAGIHDLPTVLDLVLRYPTIEAREAALDKAIRSLVSRNMIVDGAVHPEVVSMLQTLQRPDREFAMRFATPDGTARISVVRRGSMCVLARRVGDDIVLRIVGHRVDVRTAASALLAELPQAKAAEVPPVGAPLPELSERLSDTHAPLELADRIRAVGADPQAAMLLGTALGSRQAFAEIVYYALADDEGRISRGPAAVAVFYTKRGRIIAAPSVSPSGQLWTTLKAGTDHAFTQAIGQLAEVCDHRWGTYSEI